NFVLNTAYLSGGQHTLHARAIDASLNQGSSVSIPVTISNSGGADATPPTVPSGLTASAVSASQVSLAWIASTDNVGVAGYFVYRNGFQIAATLTTGFADTAVATSTKYAYYVEAFDAAGNVSAASIQISASTRSPSGAVTGVVSSAQSGL